MITILINSIPYAMSGKSINRTKRVRRQPTDAQSGNDLNRFDHCYNALVLQSSQSQTMLNTANSALDASNAHNR